MKKSEMSPEVLEARETFLRVLKDASWSTMDRNLLLDRGMSVEPEAEADYQGPAFDMTCGFVAKEQRLRLELVDRDTRVVYAHQLHPRGGLLTGSVQAVLDVVVAAQDTLDVERYPRLTKALIPLCDPLLVQTDEGLMQLTS